MIIVLFTALCFTFFVSNFQIRSQYLKVGYALSVAMIVAAPWMLEIFLEGSHYLLSYKSLLIELSDGDADLVSKKYFTAIVYCLSALYVLFVLQEAVMHFFSKNLRTPYFKLCTSLTYKLDMALYKGMRRKKIVRESQKKLCSPARFNNRIRGIRYDLEVHDAKSTNNRVVGCIYHNTKSIKAII